MSSKPIGSLEMWEKFQKCNHRVHIMDYRKISYSCVYGVQQMMNVCTDRDHFELKFWYRWIVSYFQSMVQHSMFNSIELCLPLSRPDGYQRLELAVREVKVTLDEAIDRGKLGRDIVTEDEPDLHDGVTRGAGVHRSKSALSTVSRMSCISRRRLSMRHTGSVNGMSSRVDSFFYHYQWSVFFMCFDRFRVVVWTCECGGGAGRGWGLGLGWCFHKDI